MVRHKTKFHSFCASINFLCRIEIPTLVLDNDFLEKKENAALIFTNKEESEIRIDFGKYSEKNKLCCSSNNSSL